MRKDVKFGLVFSLVVVVLAGWYFVGRGKEDKSVPIGEDKSAGDTALAAADKSAAAQASAKPGHSTKGSKAHRPSGPAELRKGQSGPRRTSKASKPEIRKPDPSQVTQSDKSPGRKAADEPRPAPDAAKPSSIADILSRRTDTPSQPPAGAEAAPDAAGVTASATGPDAPSVVGPTTPVKDVTTTPGADQPPIASPTKPRVARRTPPGAKTHVVEQGDTLAILSELYYGSQGHVDLILSANPQVTDPARLAVGTKLVLPPLSGKLPTLAARPPAPEKPAAPKPEAATPPAAKTKAAPGTYEVKAGDSFYKIAEEVLGDANRWPEIFELNKDLVEGKPERLKVGQVLKLPPKEKPKKE